MHSFHSPKRGGRHRCHFEVPRKLSCLKGGRYQPPDENYLLEDWNLWRREVRMGIVSLPSKLSLEPRKKIFDVADKKRAKGVLSFPPHCIFSSLITISIFYVSCLPDLTGHDGGLKYILYYILTKLSYCPFFVLKVWIKHILYLRAKRIVREATCKLILFKLNHFLLPQVKDSLGVRKRFSSLHNNPYSFFFNPSIHSFKK